MILLQIVVATGFGGLLSVLLAATLTFTAIAKVVQRLVSLSVGLLLATAILTVLPESINSGANVDRLAWIFLLSLLFLVFLEKIAIFRHNHHHEGDGHEHHHGHDHAQAGAGGLGILVGDSVHNFADGVMVAAAFLIDPKLGWITAFSVLAHEVPQEIGDFVVLVNAGYSRQRAIFFNLLSGLACVLGGILGYFFLNNLNEVLPYVLMITVASFIYVALADLLPSIQASTNVKDSAERFGLLLLGVAIVCVIRLFHSH
jgi:zinc and cadmium transporter